MTALVPDIVFDMHNQNKNELYSLILLKGDIMAYNDVVIFQGDISDTVLLAYLQSEKSKLKLLILENSGEDHGFRRVRDLRIANHFHADAIFSELTEVFSCTRKDLPLSRLLLEIFFSGSYANTHQCDRIVLGITQTELIDTRGLPGSIIPELQEFITKYSQGLIKLFAPFRVSTLAAIIRMGACFQVPFEITWSCEQSTKELRRDFTHCGLCGGCLRRRYAFKTSGIPDPTVYNA